jgi:hypothetical protein
MNCYELAQMGLRSMGRAFEQLREGDLIRIRGGLAIVQEKPQVAGGIFVIKVVFGEELFLFLADDQWEKIVVENP